MKSRVVFMALLCLLLIFTGAYAATAPKIGDLTYNGSDQPLAQDSGTPDSGYTYYFRLKSDTPENWSTTIPTGKAAGTYYLQYLHTNIANPASSVGETNTREVKIAPVSVTVTWPEGKLRTVTYNGQKQAPEPTVTGILDADKDTCTWAYTEAEPKDVVNNKEIKIKFSGDSCVNYRLEESYSTNFTIEPATLTITPNTNARSKVYGDPDPAMQYSVSGLASGESIVTGNNFLSREEGENTGKYNFKLGNIYDSKDDSNKFKTSNYNEPVLAAGIQFEITKASNGIVTYAKVLEPTYNGSEQTLIEAAIPKGGTVMYFLQGETPSSELPTGKNAGDYDIYYYVAGGDNYENFRSADSPNGPIKATIKKATIIVTPDAGQTKKSGDPEPVLTYKVTDPEGNIVDIELDGALARRNNNEAVGGYNIERGTLTLSKADEDNYDIQFTTGVRFNILSADITEYTEPAAEEGLVYDGNTKTLITAGQTENGTFMYFLEGDNTAYETLPTAKKAGDYKVFYYIKGSGNYGDKGSFDEPFGFVTVTIAKATLTIVPTETLTKKYGTDDPEPFNYEVKLGKADMTAKAKQNISGNLTRAEGEAVGKYAFSVEKLVMNEAYKANFDKLELAEDAAEFEITLGNNERTGYSQILDLTYNGNPQTLITEATAKGGTVMYFIEGETPSSELPKATNAGEYKIFYYVVGDDKYGDLASQAAPFGPINAEIKPLTVNVIPKAVSKVYGAEDPELTYTFDPASPVPGVTGNIGRNKGEAVGHYYFNLGDLALDETSEGNFELYFKDNDMDHLFSITKAAKAKVTAPIAKTGLVYNVKAQDLLETPASVEGDETAVIVYQIGSAKTTGMPNAKDAGDYEIKYYIQEDANHDELHDDSWKLTVSIAKAPLTAVPNENQSKSYGAKDPDVFTFRFDGLVNSEGNPKFTGGIAREEGENVGTYAYTAGDLALPENSNYELTFDDAGVTFKITEAQASITAHPKAVSPLTYTGEPQTLITAGTPDGGTMMYYLTKGEESEELPSATDAGTYYVHYFVKGDDNHADYHYSTEKDNAVKVEIAKAQVVVTPKEGQYKIFGDPDPVFEYTYTPTSPDVAVEPQFTGKLDRSIPEGDPIGIYDILQGNLRLTEESNKNFEYEYASTGFTSGVKFEVRKVSAELTKAPVVKNTLTYEGNGVYQPLLKTLGEAKGGEIWYQLSRDGKTFDPVNTNPGADWAGDYTITYFIKGDENHSDVTNDEWVLHITIEKAAVTVTPDAGQTKEVGKDDPDPLTFSSDGWKASDPHVLEGKLAREDGETMGKYEIQIGSIKLGTDEVLQHNYDVKFVSGVMFEITPSQEEVEVVITGNKETHGYTGDEITMEKVFQLVNEPKGITESDITCSRTVSRTDKGTTEAELSTLDCKVSSASYPNAKLISQEGAKAVLIINAGTITEDDYTAPQAKTMPYDGSDQKLIEPGTWNGVIKGVFQYRLGNYVEAKSPEYPTEFSTVIPVGDDAGTYTVEWKIVPLENYDGGEEQSGVLTSEITPIELTEDMIQIQKVVNYTGEEQQVEIQVYVNGNLVPETEYEIAEGSQISGTEPGVYSVTINGLSPNFTGSVDVTWEIKDMVNRISMFRVGEPDKVCLRCGVLGGELPATGFPTRVNVPLAVKPQGLDYAELGMRIQIPTLDVDVELAGVPTMDGAWKVEWLADRAGLLSGTALPGDGYSIVAAHNTLNAEEVGPFVLLSTLDDNDTIFVNAPDGSMKLFRVYANELLAPNDMETLASIAEQESNTLVLVTCENESVDGGYLNRRVVFAKPLN